MRPSGMGWVDENHELVEHEDHIPEGPDSPEPDVIKGSEEDTRERKPAKKDTRADKAKQ